MVILPFLVISILLFLTKRKSSTTTLSVKHKFPSSCGDDGNSEIFLLTTHLKTFEIECEETNLIDRISHLPNTIIVKTLSRLPTTDAFRISILSKHCK